MKMKLWWWIVFYKEIANSSQRKRQDSFRRFPVSRPTKRFRRRGRMPFQASQVFRNSLFDRFPMVVGWSRLGDFFRSRWRCPFGIWERRTAWALILKKSKLCEHSRDALRAFFYGLGHNPVKHTIHRWVCVGKTITVTICNHGHSQMPIISVRKEVPYWKDRKSRNLKTRHEETLQKECFFGKTLLALFPDSIDKGEWVIF